MRRLAVAVALILLGASPVRAETLTFQEGVDGYTGTQDLHLAIPENATSNGHRESQYWTDPDFRHWVWDFEATWGEGTVFDSSGSNKLGLSDLIGLLRFRDLFGDAPGQIPPGATITSATLTLEPDNPFYKSARKPGDPANLHEVWIDWDESARWDDFGPQPGPDMGVDFDDQIVATTPVPATTMTIDVTSSLQKWSQDPSSNRGWLFMPAIAQDVITVSGSAIANVTNVTVDLEIDTPQRGELVVTLRHGAYTSLLLNRMEASCGPMFGTVLDDIDITFDDAASTDVHFPFSSAEPLTGTYRPDAYCPGFDLPLCSSGGTAGLCGQPADGDWVLSVTDEFNNGNPQAQLVSWQIHLSDGVTNEQYSSSPALTIPKRHAGNGFSTEIWSSEAATTSLRPKLSVTFTPTPVFTPTSLVAHPGAGNLDVTVRIPDGSNDGSAVTVSVASDAPSVVSVPGSPLVFGVGAPTSQDLTLSIGSAGSATLTATNDASLGVATLPVSVAVSDVTASPDAIYRALGAPNESLAVSIPRGSNASSAVDLTLASDAPGVVDFLGSSGGVLPLSFGAGTSETQNVTLVFGASVGTATLTLSDDAATLGSAVVPVALSQQPAVTYEVTIEPYLQLGDAPLGAATGQLVVAWQTTRLSVGGPSADRFEVEYRKAGDPSWLTATIGTPIEHGSTSRLNQNATLGGLLFDESYEYRVIHYRDEVQIAVYQDVHQTRPSTGSFRFTAFGNSGQGTSSQDSVAASLASFDPDLHVMLGDHIYDAGEFEHYRSRMGNVYGEMQADTPVVSTLGNHDGAIEAGQSNLDYFFLPENGPAGPAPELNYSFDWGDAHFAVVNSGTGLNHPDMENVIAPWLAADLAASTRTWKIVMTHEPPVTRDPFGIDRQEQPGVRDFLLKAAVEQGADLFLAGATHSYQRYLPITSVIPTDPYVTWATCEQGYGTTLVYPGTGSWALGSPPVTEPLDPPMVKYIAATGVGVFDVTPTTLSVSFAAGDSITLNKCTAPANCPCASCGDGNVDPGEQCDDGNATPGDGCSDACQYEHTFQLYGRASGGTVELILSGVALSVPTVDGETTAQVAANVAAAINADPTLQGLGVTATAVDGQLWTNGSIDDLTFTDPTLASAPIHLPLLSPAGWLALCAALLATATAALRRRRQS